MDRRARERSSRRGRRTEGRAGGLPARRAESAARPTEGSPAGRPRRVRRESSPRSRWRRGLNARRAAAAGATRVLAMSTTRRAAVLAIVVCALAFTLAVPLRTYLSQRSEISEQEQRRDELRADVARLQERQAALNDPAQVETEARRRLRYVMPGETPYLVQLPEDNPQAPQPQPQQQSGVGGMAWYQQLWATLGR
ncbi:FtsB family cell division protein [Amycolatopsis cynarae]